MAVQVAHFSIRRLDWRRFGRASQSSPKQLFMTRFLGFPESLTDHWYAIGEVLMGVDPVADEQGYPEVQLKVLDEFAGMIEQVLE